MGLRLVDLVGPFTAADHLTLHAPLLDSTQNQIDAAALTRIRPGEVLMSAELRHTDLAAAT